jgi:hypothetical protein
VCWSRCKLLEDSNYLWWILDPVYNLEAEAQSS